MGRAFHGNRPGDEPVPGYHLVRFLGKGQFGEVWQASAPGKNEVALKIIDLRGREGLKEFEALERIKHIRHPNLAPIFASWLITADGQVVDDLASITLPAKADPSHQIYETMAIGEVPSQPIELIVAMGLGVQNLSTRLAEYRKRGLPGIDIDELMGYMEGSAQGIDYLNQPVHDLGEGPKSIIHGDIKPQNLLIVGNAVQICDFGLVRAVEALRRTATAMGTYAYAAPELLEGRPHVRSDQYCLAVSYIELRTGELPLGGETSLLMVAQMHREGKLDLSKLSSVEAKVLRKALSPDPAGRYDSCGQMVRALRRLFATRDSGSVPSALPVPEVVPSVKPSSGLGLEATRRAHAQTMVPEPAGVSWRGSPELLGRTPSLRALSETLGARRTMAAQQGRKKRAGWKTAIVLLLLMGAIGGGAYFALSGSHSWWPRHAKDDPGSKTPEDGAVESKEYFAKEFNRIEQNILQSKDDQDTDRLLKERKGLVGRWTKRIHDLAAKGEFAEAVEILNTAPATVGNFASEGRRDEIRKYWNDLFNESIRGGDYSRMFELFEKAPAACMSKEQLQTQQERLCGRLDDLAESATGDEMLRMAKAIETSHLPEPIRKSQIAKLRTRLETTLDKLLGERRFDDAFGLLNDIPDSILSKSQRSERAKKLVAPLRTLVIESANRGDFVKALGLLGLLDDATRRELLGNIRNAWTVQFDKLVADKDTRAARERLQKVPAGLLTEDLRKASSDKVLKLWKDEFDDRLKGGRFAEVSKMLNPPPPEISQSDAKNLREKIGKAWKDEFDRRKQAGRLVEALDLLNSPPPDFSESDVSARREDIRTAWMADFNDRKQSGRFLEALKMLSSPPPVISESDAKELQETIRTAWLGQMNEDLKKPAKVDKVGDALTGFLSHFPRSPETNAIQAEVDRLHQRPPEKKLPVVLAEVRRDKEAGKLAEARQRLQTAAGIVANTSDPNGKAIGNIQIRLWQAILDLSDPASQPSRITAAMGAAREILPENSASWPQFIEEPLILCEAIAKFVLRPDRAATAEELDLAIRLVRTARKRDPRLGPLWAKRIELYTRSNSPPPPSREEFSKFDEDWRSLDAAVRAGLPRARIDAWRCECLLLCSLNDSVDRDEAFAIARDLPKNDDPYIRYVRALALRAASAEPETMLDELTHILPEPGTSRRLPPELASSAQRLKHVASWAVTAIDDLRRARQPRGLFAAAWADPARADESFKVLKAVRALGPVLSESDKQRDLNINLALAAICKTKPDLETTRAATAELIKLRDQDLGREVMAVLFAYIGSRTAPGAPQLAADEQMPFVATCTRLVKLLAGHESTRLRYEGDARALKRSVLDPAPAIMKTIRPCRQVFDYHAAAAELVWNHRDAGWGTNLNDWLAVLLSSAIESSRGLPAADRDGAAATVATCLVRRGQVELERTKPDFKQAIDDANSALQIGPAIYTAHGVLADAFLRRALSRSTRPELLSDLKLSIDEGRKAKGDPDKSARAKSLLVLSDACIQRANYDSDPAHQETKAADLQTAIESAREAEQLQSGQADYPYLTLGNAYEDLAWLEENDPETNYNLALRAFAKAAKTTYSSAQAYCNAGRTYYKLLAETYLDPSAVGKASKLEVIDEAIRNLEEAVRQDNRLVEGYFYLALCHQYKAYLLFPAAENQDAKAQALKQFELADQYYKRTIDLAEEQKLVYRAIYISTWASFPLGDERLAAAQRGEEALRRAAELRKGLPMPLGGSLDPLKEAAKIEADVAFRQERFKEALDSYSALLPKPIDNAQSSDFSLLLGRAQYCYWWAQKLESGATAEPTRQQFIDYSETAAQDAALAARVGFYRNRRADALNLGVKIRMLSGGVYMRQGNKNLVETNLSQALLDIRTLMKLAPRRPAEGEWYERGVVCLITLANLKPDPPLVPYFRAFVEAVDWQDRARQLATTDADRKRRNKDLKDLLTAAVQRWKGVRADILPTIPSDISEKAAGWEGRLSALQ